jgi:hypothetical protein
MRDTLVGLDASVVQTAVMADPPPREAPVTPFVPEDESEGIYRPPVAPNQDYPTRRPETA